jgi:hypothetical protein
VFPKTEDGYVLIPINPRNKPPSEVVKIRNATLSEGNGKVFVESTKDPSLKAELGFFCRSWYNQWILAGEGAYV